MTGRPGRPGRETWAFVGQLVATLSAAAVIVLLATQYLYRPWTVHGPSMEPALRDGDRILVDLWTFRRRGPLPGEIVLVEPFAPGVPMVKRVTEGPRPDPEFGKPVYIVLGDNLKESLDSREFGAVSRERIRGRIVFRYWPLSRAGAIE